MMKHPALLLFSLLMVVATVTATRDQVLFLGGKGVTQVNVLTLYNPPKGNCSLIPDVPFEPLYSIGLRDNQGRAMVCGGNKNPNPKSCWILDRPSNTWVPGPNLKRERVGAAVACLDNGICWVFGGRSRSTTEWYNPKTHEFEIGPAMPVNSVHGLCAEYGPITDQIFIVARREPGKVRTFTFNPTTEEFQEFESVGGLDVRYSACGVVDYDGNEEFVMVGGGLALNAGKDWGFLANPTFSAESIDNYPYELIGAVGVPVEPRGDFRRNFMIAGGVTPEGEYPTEMYSYYTPATAWYPYYGFTLDPPRAFPVVVAVEEEDCPYECP